MKISSTGWREIALILFLVLWCSAIAWGDVQDKANGDFLMFLVLLGIIQGLIGYIYTSNQKSRDRRMDDFQQNIKDLYQRKMDTEHHREICDIHKTKDNRP